MAKHTGGVSVSRVIGTTVLTNTARQDTQAGAVARRAILNGALNTAKGSIPAQGGKHRADK